ncbi:MAG: FAD:protein FMN transferase [Mogibacterium sp.]|nr:FAD:protein FMN transferase [Mogibacterium sp.]
MMIILSASLLAGCNAGSSHGSASAEPVTGENYYLDTVCTISIFAMKGEDGTSVPASDMAEAAEAAIDKAFAECAALDKKLTRTNEASEIGKVNNAGGEWTEVSEDTAGLVQKGIEYSELSGGDFDITIGGVTDLWDFHADPEDAKVPDADALAEAVTHVGYNNIEINGNMLRINDPEARIDLGGIAKGYIGDRMTVVLEQEGVTSGIINLGGNVICIGGKYSGEEDPADFVIGVEAPYSDRTEIVGKIGARDMTLVTSGVYERQITVDGKSYHHILSTKTGYSVETDLDAVTLTAAKGKSMDIDALSTICLIKGYEGAKELIESIDGIEAVFILHDGSVEKTSGMEFEPVK